MTSAISCPLWSSVYECRRVECECLKSYFSDRSQRVLIDDVMSGVANLVCGVPQGSVLGPLKFCLYLLPLGAILRSQY